MKIGERHISTCFLLIVFFASGFLLKTGIDRHIHHPRRDNADFKFVKPIQDDEDSIASRGPFYMRFRSELRAYIERQKRNGVATRVGVFFRDLDTYEWVGVNEQDKFTPASLFKLPVMMAFMKASERDPGILGVTVPLDTKSDSVSTQEFSSAFSLTDASRKYTVHELLKAMIAGSDNRALSTLLRYIPAHEIFEVYYGVLGVKVENTSDASFVTPRMYATFLRSLYNAAYLNRETSEKALELLAASDFSSGIVAGVPKGTPVAHKYGERGYEAADGTTEENFALHDCGIIYTKDTDYSLCVMTEGPDLRALTGVIADISKQAYEFVDTNH